MSLENFVLLAHLLSTHLQLSQFYVESLEGARQFLLLQFQLVDCRLEVKDDSVELGGALFGFLESGLTLSNVSIKLLGLPLFGFDFILYLEHTVIDSVERLLLFRSRPRQGLSHLPGPLLLSLAVSDVSPQPAILGIELGHLPLHFFVEAELLGAFSPEIGEFLLAITESFVQVDVFTLEVGIFLLIS